MSQQITFLASDLRDLIADLSLVRRKAVLFAYFEEMTAEQVMNLRWRDLRGRELTPFADAIVAASPKHPKVDYVFWEWIQGGVAAPLFALGESVFEASGGFTFEDLRGLFKRMVWHDTGAELRHFQDQLDQARSALH